MSISTIKYIYKNPNWFSIQDITFSSPKELFYVDLNSIPSSLLILRSKSIISFSISWNPEIFTWTYTTREQARKDLAVYLLSMWFKASDKLSTTTSSYLNNDMSLNDSEVDFDTFEEEKEEITIDKKIEKLSKEMKPSLLQYKEIDNTIQKIMLQCNPNAYRSSRIKFPFFFLIGSPWSWKTTLWKSLTYTYELRLNWSLMKTYFAGSYFSFEEPDHAIFKLPNPNTPFSLGNIETFKRTFDLSNWNFLVIDWFILKSNHELQELLNKLDQYPEIEPIFLVFNHNSENCLHNLSLDNREQFKNYVELYEKISSTFNFRNKTVIKLDTYKGDKEYSEFLKNLEITPYTTELKTSSYSYFDEDMDERPEDLREYYLKITNLDQKDYQILENYLKENKLYEEIEDDDYLDPYSDSQYYYQKVNVIEIYKAIKILWLEFKKK